MWATELLAAVVASLATLAPTLASAGAADLPPATVPMPPERSAPRIDALPVPASHGPVDLEAVARGFGSGGPLAPLAAEDEPRLLIFISLSMPAPTLKRLAEQAGRAGAVLKLRGLVDASLPRTVARVQRLLSDRRVAVQIDPETFDRYAIDRVPTFVLVQRNGDHRACGASQCAPEDAFVRVAGDVSLDYALDHFQRSSPRFADDATKVLARLGRRP